MARDSYIIRGGSAGRERLRVLARVMRPTTLALFERIGVRPAWRCLDVGCGGGDVAVELARLVGPHGRVVGIDRDPTTLKLARAETAGVASLAFVEGDVTALASELGAEFDLVYARFVLSHLPEPGTALAAMRGVLRAGGTLAVEDVDFSGHFSWPDVPAFRRYVDLYTRTAQRRGADPTLGQKLPALLKDAGLASIGAYVVQPVALDGEVNLMAPITMESIAAAVIDAGLAAAAEVEATVADLYAAARDGRTLLSLPRIVQAWGATPSHALWQANSG